MNWDDLRHVLAVSSCGSLVRAGRKLEVDHTTVGRRVEAAEASLGARLFTRTPGGYVRTAECDKLLAHLQQVEEAVLALERHAGARTQGPEGTVRVTAPETFGVAYLAPRLALFGREHPGLRLELIPAGQVMDLGRGEAEVAVRFFRSADKQLVVRRAGAVAYSLYGARAYLAKYPVRGPDTLHQHAVLSVPSHDGLEAAWLERLDPKVVPRFITPVSLALLAAARAGAGLAVLPRYLGDAEPTLRRVPMPDEPVEHLWLTVHRDLQRAPRVRAVLDAVGAALRADAKLLAG